MPPHKTLPALVAVCCLVACSPDPYPGEQGKILHASLRLLPKTFDPPKIEDEGSGKIAAHVYDGLLQYHPFARPYKLTPALAASMPEVGADKTTYTFRLKPGIRFVDDPCFADGKGREVVARDFVYCFKRFAHPETKSKGWWLFDGWICGLNEWRKGLRDDIEAKRKRGEKIPPLWGLERTVEGPDGRGQVHPGFEVIGRYTLRFHLRVPYPQFLWGLAMPYLSVYPHEAVDHYGAEFRNHPVGTGPFRVVEFNPVYRVVYARNESFRDERFPDPRHVAADRIPGWDWAKDEAAGLLAAAGKKMPLLDGIETRFILEGQPRWLYFKNGFTDFLNPPKDNVDEALPSGELSAELRARGVRLDPWPELGTVYTCFNCEDPLLRNVDVRRAIALAHDHRWTVDNLYAKQAQVAFCLIPPGVAGHVDYHPYHGPDGRAQVEKAKEILARAGYPGGIDPKSGKRLRVRFENSGTSTISQQFAERLVLEMKRIGIDVDVVQNTFPQMLEKMRKKQFQLAGLAWGFDYPDAQNILQLLYGPNASPGPGAANFRNAGFDRLYEEARTMEDGPERTRLYERMARIVADEVPWVTRAHRLRQNLQQPWLSGFKYTEITYQFWRWADVDVVLRRRLVRAWNRAVHWPLIVLGVLFLLVLGKTMVGGRPA